MKPNKKNVSNLRKLMKLRKNNKKLVMIIQVNIIFFFLFVINQQRKKYSYFYSNFSTKTLGKIIEQNAKIIRQNDIINTKLDEIISNQKTTKERVENINIDTELVKVRS